MKKFNDMQEVIDFTKKEPVKAFFYYRILGDLMDEMADNADDFAEGMLMTCSALVKGLFQIAELVLLPITKLVRFIRLRNRIMKERSKE